MRDPRWENVFARVGQHQYDIDTNEYNPPEHICEIYVELRHEGMLTFHRTLVFKDEVEQWFKQVLDKSVDAIDRALAEKQKE